MLSVSTRTLPPLILKSSLREHVMLDKLGRPGIGVFVWRDGAHFQEIINQYMGEQNPYGLDPTITYDELGGNGTRPLGLRFGNTTGSGG